MRGAIWGAAMLVAALAAGPAAAQDYETQDAGPSTAAAIGSDAAPPVLPFGMAASFVAPPHDPRGGYVTPNRDLSPEEVTWHVRVALNVAALGCRQQAGETAAAYNALLVADRAVLAAALDGIGAAMTKLYNFWAQPPAQEGFCREATAVLRAAQAVAPADFPAFAAAALPRLEAPFLAAFAAIETYRDRMARWNGEQGGAVVIATAAAVPIGPRLGPEGP